MGVDFQKILGLNYLLRSKSLLLRLKPFFKCLRLAEDQFLSKHDSQLLSSRAEENFQDESSNDPFSNTSFQLQT